MTHSSRSQLAWHVLRITLAGLLAAHGWFRLLAGGVEPFGGWLESRGVPFGVFVAAGVTAVELLGTPVLAWGRAVLPLCLVYSGILTVGIAMVHAREGWFVVGGGRNGVEYSVLLIVALVCVGWQNAPRGKNGP